MYKYQQVCLATEKAHNGKSEEAIFILEYETNNWAWKVGPKWIFLDKGHL